MNFKTVHGLGRSDYALKALNAALDKGIPPVHVDTWLKWFDEQPADNLDGFTEECRTADFPLGYVPHSKDVCAIDPDECCNRDASGCGNCLASAADKSSQCAQCDHMTVCADDCPQAEYYAGDLEEVAHGMVTRTENALSLLVQQMARPGSVATLAPEVKALFDGIRAEISLPGYVEGLITE